MRPANLETLKERIVRPDIDKHLVPLMLYRGANNVEAFGRMTRVWNFAITMMESECEDFSAAVRLASNPDYSHLCGPRRPLTYGNFSSAFGRLRDNPGVTANIPGLTDYVKSVQGPKWSLTPISIYTNDPTRKGRNWAPWRINDYDPETKAVMLIREAEKLQRKIARAKEIDVRVKQRRAERDAAKAETEQSKALFYPYIVHKPRDGDDETALVLEVNNAIPKHLPDYLRADMCQDLIVAVLSGEVKREDIKAGAKAFVRKVFKDHPIKYGHLSLDAIIPGTENLRLIDTIADDAVHF